MIYSYTAFGIGHDTNSNKIPMGMSHGLPTFYNQKLLEIASANDAFFSVCIAMIKLRSCGGGRYKLIVGEKVIEMMGNVVLLKLQNQ